MNQHITDKPKYKVFSIILGGLTLFLFATRPFILDFIESAKSTGQVIGETAIDIIEGLINDKE